MITRFFIYGFSGWVTEVFWTGISAAFKGDINMTGHTSVWMFWIYAFCGILFEPIYKNIKQHSIFTRGCIWTVLIFSAEALSGFFLRFFGIEAWKYETLLSVYGLIRLDYLPAWFLVGLLYEKLNNKLLYDL